MKVSVLINNYNYARFLPEALQSVVSQSFAPHEIIVVDDGSKDESLHVLKELSSKIPSLRIHSQENSGQLSALRSGVELATGDWCVFLDADDAWDEDHLARLASVVAEHPEVSAYYCGHTETEGPPVYRMPWPEGMIGPSIALVHVTRLRIGTLTSAISLRTDIARHAVTLMDGMESDWRIRADDCLVYGAALNGALAYHQPKPSVRYRIHGGNSYARRDRALAEYRDKFRLARLCEYYAARVGVRDGDLRDHIRRELTFPGNSHPYIRRRYRRAIRRLNISLYSKIGLYLKTFA